MEAKAIEMLASMQSKIDSNDYFLAMLLFRLKGVMTSDVVTKFDYEVQSEVWKESIKLIHEAESKRVIEVKKEIINSIKQVKTAMLSKEFTDPWNVDCAVLKLDEVLRELTDIV